MLGRRNSLLWGANGMYAEIWQRLGFLDHWELKGDVQGLVDRIRAGQRKKWCYIYSTPLRIEPEVLGEARDEVYKFVTNGFH